MSKYVVALAGAGVAAFSLYRVFAKRPAAPVKHGEEKRESQAPARVGSTGFRTGYVWSERYMWHQQGTFTGHEPSHIDDNFGVYIVRSSLSQFFNHALFHSLAQEPW